MDLLKPDETWKLCTTKTSNVWKHFLVNQNDKTKLKCVHCGYQIIWTNNSTTTLRVHLLSKSKHHSGKIIDLDKSPFGEKRPYDENKENKNLDVGNEMVVNEVQPLTSFQLSQIDSNNEAVSEVKGQTFILIKGVYFNSHFFRLH